MDYISFTFFKNVVKVLILPICIILIEVSSLHVIALCPLILILNDYLSVLNHCKIILWACCLCNDAPFCSCHLHSHFLVLFEMILS
jgi:hypothetical protein